MKSKKGSGMIYVLLLGALSLAGAAIFMARNDEPDPLRNEIKTLTTANNILAQRIEKLEKTPPPLPPVSNDSRIPELAMKLEKLEAELQTEKAANSNHRVFANKKFRDERLPRKVIVVNPDPIDVDVVHSPKGQGKNALLKRAGVKPPELEK